LSLETAPAFTPPFPLTDEWRSEVEKTQSYPELLPLLGVVLTPELKNLAAEIVAADLGNVNPKMAAFKDAFMEALVPGDLHGDQNVLADIGMEIFLGLLEEERESYDQLDSRLAVAVELADQNGHFFLSDKIYEIYKKGQEEAANSITADPD